MTLVLGGHSEPCHMESVGGITGSDVHVQQLSFFLHSEETKSPGATDLGHSSSCHRPGQVMHRPESSNAYTMGFDFHPSTCAMAAFNSLPSKSNSWVPLGMFPLDAIFF